jgi:hypothetical protein
MRAPEPLPIQTGLFYGLIQFFFRRKGICREFMGNPFMAIDTGFPVFLRLDMTITRT